MARSNVHNIYDRLRPALDEAFGVIRELREADPRFEWECQHMEEGVRLARRYSVKPGERLYRNWRWCVHARPFEDQEKGIDPPEEEKARDARALLPDEGVPYFKGLVHPECMEAINAQRGC